MFIFGVADACCTGLGLFFFVVASLAVSWVGCSHLAEYQLTHTQNPQTQSKWLRLPVG